MENKKIIIKKFEESWDIVKNEIPIYWNDLTEAQIELIIDYKSLIKQLTLAYSFTEEEIDIEIEKFMDKLGLIPLEIHLEQLRQALYQSTFAATLNMGRVLQRYKKKFT